MGKWECTLENMVKTKNNLARLNQYKGKRVFITGHTGFKGSWLVKILHLLGAEVKGYALAPATEPSMYEATEVEGLCDSVFDNILEAERLKAEIETFQPDFIFHLAAQPLVCLSYDIPAHTFAVNAVGTANLLDAVKKLEKPCVAVIITTDKVYHNNEWSHPYRECDRLGGYDPYSASKACAELVIDSYRNSFFNAAKYQEHGKAIVVARAGNVIGGGDWAADRLIPDIVRSLQKSEEVVLRNPSAVRPWQHVVEPLCGYLLLAQSCTTNYSGLSKAFNFGPAAGDTLTVEQMTSMAVNIWGQGGYRVEKSAHQPHEAGLLKLDISLAASELDWHPRLNATQALEWSLGWYRNYYKDPKSIAGFTDRQIKEYLEIA